MRTAELVTICALGAAFAAAPARAQDTTGTGTRPAPQRATADSAAAPDSAAARQPGDPRLVFEREVFNYGGAARRDPFQPLTGLNAGPLFEDLSVHMILFDPNPERSIVQLRDAAGKVYRLRRGDTAGNATVIDIGERRVVFSVIDFGVRRVEVLNLKNTREGA